MPLIKKDTIEKVSPNLAVTLIMVAVLFLFGCAFIGTLLWGGLGLLASTGLPVPTFPFMHIMRAGLGLICVGWAFNLCFSSAVKVVE